MPQVKDSLGNALRLIRPVVVMDEGHKAVSDLAFSTLYGFNPSFVLELTATPKDVAPSGGKNPKPGRHANVLVEVKGIDLDREGMIKMPLNLDPRSGSDWRTALAAALGRLRDLGASARTLHANTGTTIRPILLVQVERTGGDQRDGSRIHALDVKEWLINAGGLDAAEIAIKSADTNDLAAPENQDLMSATNRVRIVITKQALQEGWDCPSAHVLCVLAASANLPAMTQLVGRILRQPNARKTGIAALDESHVITHHLDTAEAVSAIKKGLEDDGIGDLVREIRTFDPSVSSGPRAVQRRPRFAGVEIYLPLVLHVSAGQVRPLDCEEDVLFALDWSDVDVSPLVRRFPTHLSRPEHQMRRIRLADAGDELIVADLGEESQEQAVFDHAHATRMIGDIVPNAWIARAIVGDLCTGLTARGFTPEDLGEHTGLIVEELRTWLDALRNRRAEAHFRAEVAAGRIQFRLRTDRHNWRMPFETETFEPPAAERLSAEKSLFFPIHRGDFSSQEEREVAVYLDGESALNWWHRNIARSNYAVQGWRREKIYPDFISSSLASGPQGTPGNRLVVLEMKGKHLSGNDDTEYKKAVLQLMSDAFAVERSSHVGELELVIEDGTSVECELVLMPDWKTRLPQFFG